MENKKQPDVRALLQQLRQEEGEDFVYDEARIEAEAAQHTALLANLPVKLLTILGGLLASLFLLGFLFSTGLYESHAAMLAVGLVFLAGSVWVARTAHNTMAETACVSFHLIGYLLFSLGFSGLVQNELALYGALALLAVLALFLATNSVLLFLAVLMLFGSLAAMLLYFRAFDFIHAYTGVTASLLTYLSLQEARLISKGAWFNRAYRPVRMGLVIALLAALAVLVHPALLSVQVAHYWVSGVLLIGAVLLVVAMVVRDAGLPPKMRVLVYGVCCLVLAPTVLSPAVPGALLVLLTSFYIGHKPGFVLGLLSLVYFVILFYYDLQFTLLQKSGILILSGALFLGGALLLKKLLKHGMD
ncbi:DUF4401 domain-containing protein [Pontibacter sp. E15-1]|uniref:DUF4401 domain-containing protein n=1 Tax=Pontibacter sp. E15-1 TaxID=2919918 RepID=UPI001F4F3072|nr:DUF4401 domain-containing protein [Pontibacter sp. E15-1]MCJ8165504.1 DUF4401 domain-containing protein [Pontibacter sp. E15-1]